MNHKLTETFIGQCSKYIDGQGWTTKIPIKDIEAKGYVKKLDDAIISSKTMTKAQIDCVRDYVIKELKMGREQFIDNDQVNIAVSLILDEHLDSIIQGAVAEYYLIRGDYENTKYHYKKYRKMLKELL